MNTGRQRLSARDYKGAGRGQPVFDLNRYRQFGAGLAAGLAVALLVWIYDHRPRPGDDELAEVSKPAERTTEVAPATDTEFEPPASEYMFYDMLSQREGPTPQRDRTARRNQPDEPVTKPGTYVLQAGAYRNRPDAERLRDKLGKLGIEAIVQHVSIDSDEWHRVRIGPISDLAKLNAARRQLRTADIGTDLYRIGD